MSKKKKKDTLGINGKVNDNKTRMNSYLLHLKAKNVREVQWVWDL